MQTTTSSQHLYDAGLQLLKVRGMMWFSLACALGALYWGADLAQHYGLSPGDGSVLAPLGARLAWGVGVALLGLALVVGMHLYGRQYIASVRFDEGRKRLLIDTLRWTGRNTLDLGLADVIGSRYYPGKMTGTAVSVNAPWYYVHIKGRRWPLILDGQGDFYDLALARRLLGL